MLQDAKKHASPVSSSDVAALDPDAPLRHTVAPGMAVPSHWRRLSAAPNPTGTDDHNDELMLLLDIWKDIRQGHLQSAIEQCEARSSYWRAALLQGGHLHGRLHNPADDENHNHAATAPGANVEDWGNPERALWLRTCWELGRKALVAAAAGGSKGSDDVALMEALIMSKYA